jgi:hypothetical protein
MKEEVEASDVKSRQEKLAEVSTAVESTWSSGC